MHAGPPREILASCMVSAKAIKGPHGSNKVEIDPRHPMVLIKAPVSPWHAVKKPQRATNAEMEPLET